MFRISKKQFLSGILRLILSGAAIFLGYLFCTLLLKDMDSFYEWVASVLFIACGLFLGLPGVAGCTVTYMAFLVPSYSPLVAALYALSKLPIALAAFFGRKKAGGLERINDILQFSGICAVGCLISFFAQIYFTAVYVLNLGYKDLYAVLNLLSSNICSAVFFGVPFCALIFRLAGRKSQEVSRSERIIVRDLLILMPAFMLLSLIYFITCLPDSTQSEECWCKVFLFSAAFESLLILVCWLLNRNKKHTFLGLLLFLAVTAIWGIFAKDPMESILIVCLILLYLGARYFFYDRIEKKLEARSKLRILCVIVNAVCLTLLLCAEALNNTVLVLPLADGSEPYTIVLGAPVQDGRASDVLEDRIVTAEQWAAQNPDTVFFITGGVKAESGGVSEADLIGNRLLAAGVDESRIVYEREATTTLENFQNILSIFEEQEYDRESPVTLLSSEFHYPRSTMLAAQAGFHRLTYLRTQSTLFSNILWSIREAIVQPTLFFR